MDFEITFFELGLLGCQQLIEEEEEASVHIHTTMPLSVQYIRTYIQQC